VEDERGMTRRVGRSLSRKQEQVNKRNRCRSMPIKLTKQEPLRRSTRPAPRSLHDYPVRSTFAPSNPQRHRDSSQARNKSKRQHRSPRVVRYDPRSNEYGNDYDAFI